MKNYTWCSIEKQRGLKYQRLGGSFSGWWRRGAHLPHKHIKKSTCRTILRENQLETGKIYNQSCKKNLHITRKDRKKKKKKASEWDCCPWEGSVRKGKSKQADPHSYEPLSLLGNPSGQTVGLEKPTFYFQGVGLLTIRARDLCWWLAPCCTSQSKEGNTLSQSLRTVASHEIKAKNQSSFTETGKTPRV